MPTQPTHSGRPEGRWLDEREAKAWRGFLVMRRAIEQGIDRQLEQESNLSAADYALLVPLSESSEGGIRARDLGRVVDWERSRVSHQLRRMESRGLIVRTECPTDARGTMIVLTAAGRAAIEAAAPAHVDWVREHFIDVLTPEELEMLATVSEKILGTMTAECATLEAECGAALNAECGFGGSEVDGPES